MNEPRRSVPGVQVAPAGTQVAPAGTPDPSGLFALQAAAVVVASLYFARDVLIPIALAILLGFVLAPLVGLLRRWKLPKAVAVVASVVLALSVVVAVGGVIGTQVAGLARDLPQYQATIQQKLGSLRALTLGRASDLLASIRRQNEQAETATPPPPDDGTQPTVKPVPVTMVEATPSPMALAERYLAPLLSPLATLGIVFIVAVFLLLQQEDLRDRMIRLFGSRDLNRTTVAIDDAGGRLSRYFLTQLALNAAFGTLITVGLWFIGVPSPVLWGVVAGLMRFVPYIGAFISSVVPIALAAAVDPGWSMALWTFALFAVTEPIMGHVVEPLVYGNSTGLSPFAVIVAAIFWTWLWGPIGLVLSTPITLCLVVLGRHVERLEFLDVLFGDRPALSPAESFYQRMLAGDPDEALQYAEELLKARSLSSYYDEVALKGLQLAASDLHRGVLQPAQAEQVKKAALELARDLAAYEDVDPALQHGAGAPLAPPTGVQALEAKPALREVAPDLATLPPEWRHGRAILCIAGRGELDEATATLLAQLLGKHGLGAEVVPHEDVARDRIATLDVSGVAMVCISYLEISGNPAHLRYLLTRLRRRLPGVPMLVGLWPAEDAILTDATLRTSVGADHYTVSLREALKACLAAARQVEAPAVRP